MPKRCIRRLLEVEQLEARLYLSGLTGSTSNQRRRIDRAAISITEPGGSILDGSVEVQRFSFANNALSVVVLDVNGFADTTDAVLAAFDSTTGALLTTTSVSGGQIILVTNTPSSNDNFEYLNSDGSGSSLAWLQVDRFFATVEFVSDKILDQAPATDGDKAAQKPPTTIPDHSTGSSLQQGMEALPQTNQPNEPPGRPPVIVVFPHGLLPPPLNADADANGSEPIGPSRGGSDRALILAPGLPYRFGMFSQSPWWTRATELTGVQARVNDLLGNGLQDANQWRRSSLGSESSDGINLPSVADGSRLLIRRPSHLMVFATPRASDQSGATDAELAIYNFATGELKRPGYAVKSRLVRSGSEIAFLSSEWDLDAGRTGDEPAKSPVLQFFDPATLGVRNTGVGAESIRLQGGQLILGIRSSTRTGSLGLDSNRLSAFRFDPGTGRLINMHRWFDSTESPAALFANGDNRRLIPTGLTPFAIPDQLAGSPIPGLAAPSIQLPIDTTTAQFNHEAPLTAPDAASSAPAGPPTPGGSSE